MLNALILLVYLINHHYHHGRKFAGKRCKCVSIRPLLTVDPNQNPKTYFWIGFGFGQLTQKRKILYVVNHPSTVTQDDKTIIKKVKYFY